MSEKELGRLEVVQRVNKGEITQVAAGGLLSLSDRQVRRLLLNYQQIGAVGLVSKRRNRPSNHRLPESLKTQAIALIEKHYPDFGPTFACEKLAERHGIRLSKETVRQLMMQAGLWRKKQRKRVKVQPQRPRRDALGELVQLDGSFHGWFEERAAPCCLLVMIDDATGRLLGLRFEAVENTAGYFRLWKDYLTTHGRPLACYHDKHGIFQVNAKEALGGSGITQFERAMNELGIESISANSPQAKGRVERANQTLQDRLIKELRLHGINDRDSANAFLPQFMDQYNQKFAVQPRCPKDFHRQTRPDEATLNLILSDQHTRKVSKNLEISFQNKIYQITLDRPGYTLRGARLRVCVDLRGDIMLLYKNKKLPYQVHERRKKISQLASAKELNRRVNALKSDGRARGHQPAANHPWRHYPKQSSSRPS